MGIQKVALTDNSKLLQQNTNGLLVGNEKVMDLGTGTPAADEIPVAADTTGQNMTPSGAKVSSTAETGGFIKVAAFVDADPISPSDNDAWFLFAGGQVFFKYRIGGVTKSVELT